MSTHHPTLKPAVGADDHAHGPANAPVTLVEYGDFECPHCAHAHSRVAALRKRFGDRLRFVYRNFPLSEMHPHALHAAEAAESVAVSGGADAFWKMHDLLFEHQQDDEDALDDAHLARYAVEAGGNAEQLQLDLDGDAYVERVRTDFMGGVRSGVNGTPTFFINGVRYEGDWSSVASFAGDIEAVMPAGNT